MTQDEIAALRHIVATATNPEKEIPELLAWLEAAEKTDSTNKPAERA